MSEKRLPWIGIVGLVGVALVCLGSGCASFERTAIGPLSGLHSAYYSQQPRARDGTGATAWDGILHGASLAGDGVLYFLLYQAIEESRDRSAPTVNNYYGDAYNASVGRDGDSTINWSAGEGSE